jgi:hypothetical protein
VNSQAGLVENAANEGAGALLLETELGMGVEIAPQAGEKGNFIFAGMVFCHRHH